MGKRIGEGQSGQIIDCPKCGCPNRSTDIRCTYCRVELSSAKPGLGDRLEHYFNYLKFKYKLPRYATSAREAVKYSLIIMAALLLFFAGSYLIYLAMTGEGFLYLCIGILLCLYGGGAIYSVYNRPA
ncbi:MAG: hypothetical protein OEY64_02745 [Nitrospinota bacterium]|nr:hypothetical protein [Nitrospinota bacterium]